MIKKYFLIPNYSLFIFTVFMMIVGIVLDFIYVPDDETVFKFSFLEEGALAFSIMLFAKIWESKYAIYSKVLWQNIWHWIVGFLFVYIVLSLFGSIKSIIHVVNPKPLDEVFIFIEQILHGGFLPSVLVTFFLQSPIFILFIDKIYYLWFFVNWFYLMFVLFGDPHDQIRERMLFSYCATWVLAGNVLAAAMASYGPIFLGYYLNQEDMSPMAIQVMNAAKMFEDVTKDMELFAQIFKDSILEFTNNSLMVDFNGPSAMPSLHVGIAALMVFHSRHVNKYLFYFCLVHLVFIMMGSVVLQWHYAIDGYIAILAAYLVWKASGFLPKILKENLKTL